MNGAIQLNDLSETRTGDGVPSSMGNGYLLARATDIPHAFERNCLCFEIIEEMGFGCSKKSAIDENILMIGLDSAGKVC